VALSCGLLSVGLVLDPGPNARSGGATVRLERERISKELPTGREGCFDSSVEQYGNCHFSSRGHRDTGDAGRELPFLPGSRHGRDRHCDKGSKSSQPVTSRHRVDSTTREFESRNGGLKNARDSVCEPVGAFPKELTGDLTVG
jgi:hypothetical protein